MLQQLSQVLRNFSGEVDGFVIGPVHPISKGNRRHFVCVVSPDDDDELQFPFNIYFDPDVEVLSIDMGINTDYPVAEKWRILDVLNEWVNVPRGGIISKCAVGPTIGDEERLGLLSSWEISLNEKLFGAIDLAALVKVQMVAMCAQIMAISAKVEQELEANPRQ